MWKRAHSRYKSGRCDAWRKVKNPGYERRSTIAETLEPKRNLRLLMR